MGYKSDAASRLTEIERKQVRVINQYILKRVLVDDRLTIRKITCDGPRRISAERTNIQRDLIVEKSNSTPENHGVALKR